MLHIPFAVSLFLASTAPQEPPEAVPDAQVVVNAPEEPVPAPKPAALTKKRPKPKMTVTCSPAISGARFENGRFVGTVLCYARVTNPDERFWCPEIGWAIGDSFARPSSTHGSDCKPFEQYVAEEGEPTSWSESREFSLPPGTYQLWATISKSGKTIARDFAVVRVN